MAEQFGIISTVGANPDSFGHAGTLPSLLAGSGMDSYVFLRPERHEMTLPSRPFVWCGPDGSEVIACRLAAYSSDRDDLGRHLARCVAAAGETPSLLVFYGVGNHGGGPTKVNLESLRRMAAAPSAVDLICSTPRAFIDGLVADQ